MLPSVALAHILVYATKTTSTTTSIVKTISTTSMIATTITIAAIVF